MDSNYLNNYSKTQLESYIENINNLNNDPSYKKTPCFMTAKGSINIETVDARARLGAIEVCESVNDMESKIAQLEANAPSPSTESPVPTKKLVKVGKALYSDRAASNWAKYPVYGNGMYLIAASGSGRLFVSRDNGKTIDSIYTYGEDRNCIINDGLEDDGHYAVFRRCEIVFRNNKFFLFSNTTYKLYETEDAITFNAVNADIDNSCAGYFVETKNGLAMADIRNNKLYKYSDDTDQWSNVGNIDWGIATTGGDGFVNFNDKLYFVDWNDGLSILSDDGLTHTAVNCGISGKLDGLIVENNILIASARRNSPVYTIDGNTWNNLALPEIENLQTLMSNVCGIRPVYCSANNSYYGIIIAGGTDEACEESGLYKWSSLDTTPVRISDDSLSDVFRKGDSLIKNIDDTLYFVIKFKSSYNGMKIYTLKNDVISGTDLYVEGLISSTIDIDGLGTSNTIIAKLNDKLYISCFNPSTSYSEKDVYELKDYAATGNESDIVVATF